VGRDLLRAAAAPAVVFPDGSALEGERLFLARRGLGDPGCLEPSRELQASDCAPLAGRAAAELVLSRRMVEQRLQARFDMEPGPGVAVAP
jgi:hypothetical protein